MKTLIVQHPNLPACELIYEAGRPGDGPLLTDSDLPAEEPDTDDSNEDGLDDALMMIHELTGVRVTREDL